HHLRLNHMLQMMVLIGLLYAVILFFTLQRALVRDLVINAYLFGAQVKRVFKVLYRFKAFVAVPNAYKSFFGNVFCLFIFGSKRSSIQANTGIIGVENIFKSNLIAIR